jgi:gas vesicle protein
MRNPTRNYTTKDWVRLGAKLSLLFTEPKVRKAVGDRIKDGVDDISDTIASTIASKYEDVNETMASKYDDAVKRVNAAKSALQGRGYWPSRAAGFLLGIGVGAGLGILLAPASGRETRDAVRDKAVAAKNRAFRSAAVATERIRQSVATMPFTGTEG